MGQLEELLLDGSMWGTQRVESLEPLIRLRKLRRLSICNTSVNDRKSLMDLVSIPSLEVFDTHWRWPKGALRKLTEARPDLWVNGQRGPGWQESEDRIMDLS